MMYCRFNLLCDDDDDDDDDDGGDDDDGLQSLILAYGL